jgi:GSH-dependent disulfide-bond oxidoreductase
MHWTREPGLDRLAVRQSRLSMIDLYYWPTPNGWKVTIMLAECDLEYRPLPVNIGVGGQYAPAFLQVSPNKRIPALVDHGPPGGGDAVSVFESGAILIYLAERMGQLMPADLRSRTRVLA